MYDLVWPKEDSEYQSPTFPGWYWHRTEPGQFPRVRQVIDTVGGVLCASWGGEDTPVAMIGGEWAGPIPEPKDR